MAAKTKSPSKSKAPAPLKTPKSTKKDKMPAKAVQKQKDRLKTGLNPSLVEKAVGALVQHHNKQTEDQTSLLGNDVPVQIQITLLRTHTKASPKPIRILIPHPLYQLADKQDSDAEDAMEEAEICLIVKEESKPWCQEMIEKFPEHMGCVKKVLGLQSLRKKHARYEQRRELLSKYNFFMADDRILPMLSKALGSDFFKAKKLPVPINLTRKEALPFAIQKALSATYMSISTGTCVMIRAGTTAMSTKNLAENIVKIAETAVPKVPHKWANVQNISIKTPKSVALPVYTKSPEVLRELAIMAGVTEDIETPEVETEIKETKKKKGDGEEDEASKKRQMKSPLLRALKKQKQDDDIKSKKAKKDEEKSKTKKKRSSSVGSAAAEKSTPTESKSKTVKKKDEPETPKSDKKSKKVKATEESSEKKDFIASKKFKGSKKGYVFKMGRQGVGYYVDVKPVVDRMAMEALIRSARNKGGRGGQKKSKHRGTRRY